ncbi:MAG: flagellar biosynthesis protein FlhB [Gammaproteobacteria bacterium]|nr:flagellar biosynthesis protein FlhB [Gammaproteobacteria bacterium]
MAENENGQERTERATPRRRNEAREQGQTPHSRELNTVALLIAGSGGLLLFGGGMIDALMKTMRASFRFTGPSLFDRSNAATAFGDAVSAMLVALAPFLLVMMLAAIVAGVALGGFHLSPKALQPKWERIDPAKGLQRIFSLQGVMELVKALAKLLLVGSLAIAWLWHETPSMLNLSELPVDRGLMQAGQIVGWSFLVLSLATVIIAAVDVPFQLWSHARQLRMTRQEVRDEYKESEGKPEVKQQIRRMQRAMAERRMMQEVPKADVIVTNPTHYAVALRYEAGRMRAPKVVAKGAGFIAARIREIAAEHRIPLYEAPPLARALYHSVELDQDIPEGLYQSVAQVLAYVFQLRHPRPGVTPTPPGDLPIPPELRRDA